jgi:uncharacterized phage protein gp47/JayE
MANNITFNSFNQTLGAMIRKIIAETPLNDINAGSVLLTLLEAAAGNDFENNTAILNILELLNVNALSNNDLDNKAADLGLTRLPATAASGNVTVYNRNITKLSTNLYIIAPPPISGQTQILVTDASTWSQTGTLFIGRDTVSFEGPLAYTSITNFITYYQINLATALQNDHLSSDTVINAQGQPDYVIPSGTLVQVPANNLSPAVQYEILNDVTIPAGEDTVNNVAIIATQPGSLGNASVGTITQYVSPPFTNAGVNNLTAFTNGTDIETDLALRNRIQEYPTTLANGTSPAIIAAVIGISDPTDNKQVASAVITEPAEVGEPSILYIDDGTGFQPSYKGQSVDTLLTNATGKELFLQLANYPLPRPQVVNTATGPFTFLNGMFLNVSVDGKEESIQFQTSDFLNISAATVGEILVAINARAVTFSARFTNNSNNILLYPQAFNAETIQVVPIQVTDDIVLYANNLLLFPTNIFSYIELFQNSTRLFEIEKAALLNTAPFSTWNIVSSNDLVISVDNTPAQDQTFALSNFPGALSYSDITLVQWVTAFNEQFAGITASATPAQTMQIVSNRDGVGSALTISGGTLLAKLFPNLPLTSVGQAADFQLNRQTGNLRILTVINPGDNITAGVTDAKGYVISAPTLSGTYNVAPDGFGRPAEIVVVADAQVCNTLSVPIAVDSLLTISNPSTNVMRILSSQIDALANIDPGDFIYITPRTSNWLSPNNCGLFRVIDKGPHLTAGVDTYVDVLNDNITAQSANVLATEDVQAFSTDGYPQIWDGEFTSPPAAATLANIVATLNSGLENVIASVYQSKMIKLTSTTELGGSIAIPVVVGGATGLFTATLVAQDGNLPLIANRVSQKDLFTYFKRTKPVSGTNVWLGRETYIDVKGTIALDDTPDVYPWAQPYSEVIEVTEDTPAFASPTGLDVTATESDYVNFTRGNNKGQYRSIATKIVGNELATQQGTNRTLFDHIVGDEIELVKSLELSTDDSIVFVMDQDPSVETVDIPMSRTGEVNSGSGSGSYIPTSTEFSATDADNQPGIDFSNVNSWGTAINNTNFADYALWFQARNWYATGGLPQTGGAMILRAAQFGPNGNRIRFAIDYPQLPNAAAATVQTNTPSYAQLTYFFGSGPARATGLANGNTIAVKGPYPNTATNFPNGAISAGNYYDLTFNAGVFSSVQVGDVIGIEPFSGVSNFNQGQYSVQAISGNTIRVFNPIGSVTSPGGPSTTVFDTVADIVGSPTSYTLTAVAESGGNYNGFYFLIYDTNGGVGIWFDTNNAGSPQPPIPGALFHPVARTIKVATLISGDSAITVASKIWQYISQDAAFSNPGTTSVGNAVTVNNTLNGLLAAPSTTVVGASAVIATAGTNNISLNGDYFTIYDNVGAVAVWFDVGNGGTTEPLNTAYRAIEITGINFGDSPTQVAAAIAATVNADGSFIATSSTNVLTITTRFNAAVASSTVNTSTFTLASFVPGSLTTPEVIANFQLINIFPLLAASTLVSAIATTINQSVLMTAAVVGLPTSVITKSTAEDKYTYMGDNTALAYHHNPNDPILSTYVAMYDGENWVKTFSNANPNFIMKKPFMLQGVAPLIYSMNTAPNALPSVALGEYFKLIPTTVKNVYHHFTQKALSQLPIIANIQITNDRKNVQIDSKQLGSAGAIEVIGGRANAAQAHILGDAQLASDSNGSTLLMKIAAFPDTFNDNDAIMLTNDAGVARQSPLEISDTINVTSPAQSLFKYHYNPKVINVTPGTTHFVISDSSASYDRPAGTVWRWTHQGGATFAAVKAGDMLYAFGTLAGWSQGNKVTTSGDNFYSGLPIIGVNDGANYIDVVNPHGVAMSTLAVPVGSTVQICPTPVIKWNLKHIARVGIASIVTSGSLATVTTLNLHFLNTGDMIDIEDSNVIPDGVYGPITVTGPQTFTFASVALAGVEGNVFASVKSSAKQVTRYRIEKLGYNSMFRLSCQDGVSPGFADCGVAVDDYMLIGGTTFQSNNNGLFRVAAVDNTSIIFVNKTATVELNTLINFNNKGLEAGWTNSNPIVTGIAGTFKDVVVGDWVKKDSDPNSALLQVVSMFPSTPALATSMSLGGNYSGTTANSPGVSYDELNNYDKGVYLQAIDDIQFFEGDAAMAGDTITIQNFVNSGWFNINNTGVFTIVGIGTDPVSFTPYVIVNNPIGIVQSGVVMSVNVNGIFITENDIDKFYSIRQIQNIVIDNLNNTQRSVYITPSSREYKFSQANLTSINAMGKIGYSTDVTTGIDGYLYYTGLLQLVQRIIDGFAPDSSDYPGKRAIGGRIEILPPLDHVLEIAISVTTNAGVNLGDITNNIQSVIIDYVAGLGVGENVVMSEIISAVQAINGVASVNFVNPVPSTQFIAIAQNQKATISPANIGIA